MLLGVDIGTSSSKGALVTADGDLIATVARTHHVQRPAPGHVEMDGAGWNPVAGHVDASSGPHRRVRRAVLPPALRLDGRHQPRPGRSPAPGGTEGRSCPLQFLELAPLAAAPPRTVYMVASGDLRPSANVKCWPAQQQLEADVTAGGRVVRAGAWCGATGSTRRPGTASSPASAWGWRCSRHSAGRAADRGRGGLAVQPSRARRAAHAPRPDPDRRQLVRHVARPRRAAQPQRLADQGGRRVLDDLERGLHRRLVARRAARRGWRRARSSHDTSATSATCPTLDESAPRSSSAGAGRRSCGARRRSSACSTKAAWACSTRSSTTSCSTRSASSRSGSASRRCSPRRPRSSDDEAAAVRRLARRRAGMTFRLRHRRARPT